MNSFAGGSLDTFTRFQQFLEFERQSAQAQAAGAVTSEGDEETNSISIDGRATHWRNFRFVVRALLVRTHLGLFRPVIREIRMRAMLPCGRQGNQMLRFLLAHRFRAATAAKLPTPLPTNSTRAQGKRFPSIPHAVVQPTAPKHSMALANFDSDMRALAILINNPLVANALRRRGHGHPPLRNRVINRNKTLNLTSNKTRNKTHPMITRNKTRGLQPQTTNAKSKHNFPNKTVPDSRCSGQSTHTAFSNANFNRDHEKIQVSDAGMIRCTGTPVPSGSHVTHKVFEESDKELNPSTRKMYRLPFLARAHVETVHDFLEAEQNKCPVVGADSAPAVVLPATQDKSCSRDYTSGTRDDMSVQCPDNCNGPARDVHKPVDTDRNPTQERILAGCCGMPTVPKPSVNGVDEPAQKRARTSATPGRRSQVTFMAQNDCGTNAHMHPFWMTSSLHDGQKLTTMWRDDHVA